MEAGTRDSRIYLARNSKPLLAIFENIKKKISELIIFYMYLKLFVIVKYCMEYRQNIIDFTTVSRSNLF